MPRLKETPSVSLWLPPPRKRGGFWFSTQPQALLQGESPSTTRFAGGPPPHSWGGFSGSADPVAAGEVFVDGFVQGPLEFQA
jgi:hypothetical protein